MVRSSKIRSASALLPSGREVQVSGVSRSHTRVSLRQSIPISLCALSPPHRCCLVHHNSLGPWRLLLDDSATPLRRRHGCIVTIASSRGCRVNRGRPAGLIQCLDESELSGLRDCGREQVFLLPPSLRDWLPEDHLAWFVIATVSQLDLEAFYAAYRSDGHGRPAYDPSMVVSLLSYAYATGEFSSRGIERHCRQDIAYRVITANEVPDHATIARFVHRHQDALAGLFTAVLELCGKAGLVRAGIVVFDGTKLSGNAHRDRNLDYGQIAKEIIEQAIVTDAAEDEQHGDARGDELPEELSSDEGRRAWLARELAARAETEDPEPVKPDETLRVRI